MNLPRRTNTVYRLSLAISATLLVAFIATAVISPAASIDPISISRTDTDYLGSGACANCHSQAYRDWRGSHHDQAMQHATAATIKGDFNNAVFAGSGASDSGSPHPDYENNGALFLKKTDGFYARLATADGQVSDYKVLYTFGSEPLQQYLVAFPDGRLQQLPVAWNTLTNQWFDPQPELLAQPGEWVHWSEGGKNWNSMCADCHSSNVAKNFDLVSNGYSTTMAEIDVGCEACHGPGRDHVTAVSSATFNATIDQL